MNQAMLLLADWTEVIGFLVVVVFGILRYLLGEMGQAQEKKPAKQPPRRNPQPPPQQPRGAQGDLRSEVDEFLRRAKGLPEPESEPELVLAAEPKNLENSHAERVLRDTQEAKQAAASRQYEQVGNESVGDHVAQHVRHLKESQLAENAAKLGEEVALADDKVRARLDATFKHRLGRIAQQEQAPAPAVDKELFAADQIAAMLASPEGVRNAVILSEVLRRPADRW